MGALGSTPLSRQARNAARKADQQAQAKKDATRLCLATKRNGQVCKRESGWGTDHPGTGRCKHHAGSTRSGTIAAAHQELTGMARPIAITPGQALEGVMRLAAGQLVYATTKVAELTEDELYIKGDVKDSGNFEMIPHKWVALQERCMHALAKYAKLAADAGIAERQTNLQEAQTAMVAHMIEQVMNDVGLSEKQRAKVGPSIRTHLTLIEGSAA